MPLPELGTPLMPYGFDAEMETSLRREPVASCGAKSYVTLPPPCVTASPGGPPCVCRSASTSTTLPATTPAPSVPALIWPTGSVSTTALSTYECGWFPFTVMS